MLLNRRRPGLVDQTNAFRPWATGDFHNTAARPGRAAVFLCDPVFTGAYFD
jgi:hypothetical protein